MVATTKRRNQWIGYKFGIKIPITVEDYLKIYRETSTKFWEEEITIEMKKNIIAFDILHNEISTIGHKKIPVNMLFDVKMDSINFPWY